MKKCELCNSMARMYCDSDRAILCWDCDGKVHSANFLVAKHSRTLLCQACQTPTPWMGSGAKLGPTVSVCEKCVRGSQSTITIINSNSSSSSSNNNNNEDDDDENETDGNDDNKSGNDDDEDDDDGDNQVVPLCYAPLFSSSSSSEISSGRLNSGESGRAKSVIGLSSKRTRT